MPVREDHIYADVAHEKTVQRAGWVYGCHSDNGDHKPKGRPSNIRVQEGWTEDGRKVMRMHTTEWLTHHADGRPLKCGHLEELRLKDTQCIGCANRE